MEKFCLNWNDFEQNASNAFNQLRDDKDFLDVTLVSDEGEHLSAHKVVLSTCSDFFKDVLKKANHTNPLLFLSGFDSKILAAVLDYVYNGKVNLYQKELDAFLECAQKLKIHGLTQNLQDEKTETEYFENKEVKKSVYTGGSYLKKYPETLNAASLQEPNIIKEDMTVATISNPNVRKAATSNYDEYITKSEVGWKCNPCGKTTTTKTNMNLHVEIHIDGLSFPCTFCTMNFRSRKHLNNHKIRIHKNKK